MERCDYERDERSTSKEVPDKCSCAEGPFHKPEYNGNGPFVTGRQELFNQTNRRVSLWFGKNW